MSTPRAIRTLSRSTLASVSKPITLRATPALGPSLTGGLHLPATRHFATGSIGRKDIEGRIVPDVTKENEATVSGLSKAEEADEAPLARQSGPSLFSLSDRTIIVTGGARGLGLTIAHALVQSGADVHCLDILPEPVEPQWSEVKSEAESLGSKISYGQLNVTSPEDVYSTIGSIFQNARSTHPVRGLYHAAGINLLAPVEDIDIESFRRVIDINLVGSHLVSQAFAREYFKRHEDAPPTSTMDTGITKAGEGASIVLTASMSGTVANFGLDNAVYNSSKAGVIQLARNYAYEWSKRGIRVNTLSPGYIRTAMTQGLFDQQPHLPEIFLRTSLLGRMSTPDEFRGPVIYLLSDASSFMTGADILVDGGHTAV